MDNIASILTNKVIVDFTPDGYKKLNAKYDFFRISNDGYVSIANSFLDRAECLDGVIAVKYAGYTQCPDDDDKEPKHSVCFIMAERGSIDKSLLIKDVSEKSVRIEKISAENVQSGNGNFYMLAGLLMNGIPGLESEQYFGEQFFNTSGHLYIKAKDPRHPDKEHGDPDKELVMLEICIDKNGYIEAPVRTFSSDLLKDKIIYRSKNHPDFYSYTGYTFDKRFNILRRYRKEDKGKRRYILRSAGSKRHTHTFLDLSNDVSLSLSKSDIISEFIKRYNRIYHDISEIRLEESEGWVKLRSKISSADKTKQLIDMITHKKLPMVGIQNISCDQGFTEEVKEILYSYGYGEDRIVDEVPWMQSILPCISIIPHDYEYYEKHKEENDPYKIVSGKPIQHIISDKDSGYFRKDGAIRKDSLRQAVKTCIISLLIKQDIMDKRISLYNWNSLGFADTVKFYKAFCDPEDEHYAVEVSISKIGNIHFKKLSEDECYDTYEDIGYSLFSESSDLMFNDGCGNIIEIHTTGIYTMPRTDKIHTLLRNDSSKDGPRSNKHVDLIDGVTDIGYKVCDDGLYYFVGLTRYGMDRNVQNRCRIRKASLVKGDSFESFIRIIPSMMNVFASVGKLYQYPFPARYINEYNDMIEHGTKI